MRERDDGGVRGTGPRPIRVLRVIARMNVGGPALQVVGLARHLDARGFESLLLTGTVSEGEEDYLALRAPDVRAITVPGLGRRVRPWSDARAFVEIVRHIRRFRPAVVHTHTAKAGVLGRIAATLARVPVVVHTFHGHLLRGYFPPSITRLVVWVERLLARRTTVIASVGGRVRDELLEAGIGTPDKYRVVPPGVPVPTAVERADARRILGLPSHGPVVVFVGRLTGVKRFDRFAEMASALIDLHDDVHFLVVGGGDLDHARALAVAHEKRFTFTGWLADVGTAYSASDLIVLSSDNEGMPVSLIEAQMMGLPAVATDVGSVREVVLDGETGLVVESSSSALAGAVDGLLRDDELRTRLGTRAREWATGAFSTDRLVSDTAEIYRSALRAHGWEDV